MLRFFSVAGTVLVIFFSMSSPAFCHKMRVFAYGEGDKIIGEAAFAGGKEAINVEILVEDSASGQKILTTRTNDKGEFMFPIPEAARSARPDLLIVANAGAGHRAEWLLEAGDYLVSDTREAKAPEAKPAPKISAPSIPATVPAYSGVSITEENIRTIVDESVSRQLAPIRRHLAENSEKKMSFQDVLGGIGYLIGLAGLAAYLKSRKKGDSDDQ